MNMGCFEKAACHQRCQCAGFNFWKSTLIHKHFLYFNFKQHCTSTSERQHLRFSHNYVTNHNQSRNSICEKSVIARPSLFLSVAPLSKFIICAIAPNDQLLLLPRLAQYWFWKRWWVRRQARVYRFRLIRQLPDNLRGVRHRSKKKQKRDMFHACS